MEDFKCMPKMAHFKEGGHAKKEAYCGGGKAYKKGGEVMDEKQDKALIKKAFKQHDESEHDKEPTEIKLRKGGRASKKEGTVRKFKTGGSVVNTYEAKKSSGDLDNIKKTKDTKPGKADAPSGAKGGLNKYKTGGKVKKMADGGISGDLSKALLDAKIAESMAGRQKMKDAAASTLSPEQRAELAKQQAQASQQYGQPQAPVGR